MISLYFLNETNKKKLYEKQKKIQNTDESKKNYINESLLYRVHALELIYTASPFTITRKIFSES